MKNKRILYRAVLIILLLGLMMILIIQNLSLTPVKFLFFGMNAPVIVIILISLFVGFALGLLTFSILNGKDKKISSNPENPKAQKQNK